MNYWLDLFTGTTWKEFREAGANVSGFRPRKKNAAAKIQPGDVLLCYLTGVMRWVGALEVVGPSADKRRIWKSDTFPVRLDVEPLVMLEPDSGVPMSEFEGRLAFYQSAKDRGKFQGFLRGSPNLFHRQSDGELILSSIRQAERSPVIRPVDPKKLLRQPLFKVEAPKGQGEDTLVSIPEHEESEGAPAPKQPVSDTATTRHTEIQYELLRLGADLGLDVWVARNDRSRKMERQHPGCNAEHARHTAHSVQ